MKSLITTLKIWRAPDNHSIPIFYAFDAYLNKVGISDAYSFQSFILSNT